MSIRFETITSKAKMSTSTRALAIAAGLAGLAHAGLARAAEADAVAENTVQDIVVTATKQGIGVNASKVAISVAAYSQADLAKAGVTTVQDLFVRTPGVNFTKQASYGSGVTAIAIRGIQSRTGQSTTGIYVDETPLYSFGSNANIGGSNAYPIIFDLNRVEILRGPQGTLFGAGSEGGTVRFISNEPSVTRTSYYGKAEVSGAEGGGLNYEAGAAVGGPLVEDKLGFRFSADYRHDGGWVDHCLPVVAKAGCASVSRQNANVGETAVIRGALLWKPAEWLSITPSIHYQRSHQDNSGEIEVAISDPATGVFRQAHSKEQPTTDKMVIASLKLEAQLPDFLGGSVLTSSTSYVSRHDLFFTDYLPYQNFNFFGNSYPLSTAAGEFALGDYGIHQKHFFQEVRLASSNPEARLTWVGGAFFQAAHEIDNAHVVHPTLPDKVLANYGIPISVATGVDPYLGKYVSYNDVDTRDGQFAAFANLDYKLSDTVKVSVGGRYGHYSQKVSSFVAGPFNGTNGDTFRGSTSGNTFNPKATVTWQSTPESMFYVSAAKGYRAGGYNPQVNNATQSCQTTLANQGLAIPRSFGPDSIWSFEAGTKQRLFNNRLAIDFSVYRSNWNNIQLAEQINGCGFFAIMNLGAARVHGFDLNVQSRIGDHLKADLAVGYTDGRFTRNAYVGNTGDQAAAKGDQISGLSAGPAIPPWTITAALEYDVDLGSGQGYLRAEDTYHSKNNGPFSQRNPANRLVYDPDLPDEPSNNILNFRLGLRLKNVDAALFVNNVLDSHPLMSTFHVGQANGSGDSRYFANTFTPRTYGLNVSTHL